MKKSRKLKLFTVTYIIATAVQISCLSADGSCPISRANNFNAIKKMVLRGHTIKEFGNKSRIRCAMLCVDNDKCRSFNHDKANGICQLNDGQHVEFPGDFQPDESFSYYYALQDSELKALWPSESYGLPMPVAGCPTADGFAWVTGYRFHDTDDSSPNNKWSARLHLKGPYIVNNMFQHFCMKTVDCAGPADTEWPQGEYCIFKYGDKCPTDMVSGSIFWDDQDYDNTNRVHGTVPSGQYDQDTRIDYCCMTSGSASQPIALPTGSPFYLFPYTAECQQVQGMTVTREWFFWDGDGGRKDPVGSYPHYRSSGNDHYIYYCYYQSI